MRDYPKYPISLRSFCRVIGICMVMKGRKRVEEGTNRRYGMVMISCEPSFVEKFNESFIGVSPDSNKAFMQVTIFGTPLCTERDLQGLQRILEGIDRTEGTAQEKWDQPVVTAVG